MTLKELLKGIYAEEIPQRFKTLDIKTITCDSRLATKESLFIAVKGPSLDGAHFIPEVLQKGVPVIAVNRGVFSKKTNGICVLDVLDTRKFLVDISKRFYENPSKKVHTIGVTGTNGKTTITYLLESIFKEAKKNCGVIGTINHRVAGKVIPSKNTTPGLLDNQRYLADMAKENIDYCVMEVSSHALDQGRVEGIDFAVGIFTNLTGDHMDYHKTVENYFLAKSKLFTSLSPQSTTVVNTDDPYGKRILKMTKAKILTYGFEGKVDLTARDIALNLSGTKFSFVSPRGQISIETQLIGRHNIYNILAAAGAALAQGVDLKIIKNGIEHLQGVPGRLERVGKGQNFFVFVDYAHTEDALKNVLGNLKKVTKNKIILVFGCGGDRDKTKRPKMGRVAGKLADWSIVTSDNPRSEDPQSVVDQVASGFQKKNFEIILDREKAIQKALSSAKKGDTVLIAGKGHEDYQIFKDKTIHFDDKEVVKKYL